MYRVKVFSPNEKGKIEFTKREIEKLLQEIYAEGYKDGAQTKWTISYGGTTNNELHTIPALYTTKVSPIDSTAPSSVCFDKLEGFCNGSITTTCGTDSKLSNATATTTHTVPAKLEYSIKDNITTDINHPNNLNTILTKVIG